MAPKSKFAEHMTEQFKIRFTPAQRELIHSGGTAEVYREAMIERAKENLGMTFDIENDLMQENRSK